MEHAARGAKALDAADAQTAVAAYTQALIQHPTSPDYFVRRSTAFNRLSPPRNDLALHDAELAVLLGQKRAKREKIQAGQQRRVIALFGLRRYGDAASLLETMLKWRSSDKKDKMEGDIWKAKIDQRLKALPADHEERQVRVKEYPDFELPSEKELVEMLRSQLKADGTFKFDRREDAPVAQDPAPESDDMSTIASPETKTEIVGDTVHLSTDEMPIGDTAVDTKTSKSTTTASAPIPEPVTLTKIRHEWYQSADSVHITVYAKGVQKDQAEVNIHEDSVYMSFPHPSDRSSSFIFTLDPLFALVDLSASTSSVMSTKIEISLRKKVVGQKWPALEGNAPLKDVEVGPESAAARAAIMSSLAHPAVSLHPETAPSYPTSSKSGPKNWDKLAETLTAKKKKTKKSKKGKNKENQDQASSDEDDGIDSDYDTGDAVDGFFKKLYAGADEDTKRAMMKSFQESNGTALSTNWNEVGKGKVEPVKSKDDD